jgi:hypothetical protein
MYTRIVFEQMENAYRLAGSRPHRCVHAVSRKDTFRWASKYDAEDLFAAVDHE